MSAPSHVRTTACGAVALGLCISLAFASPSSAAPAAATPAAAPQKLGVQKPAVHRPAGAQVDPNAVKALRDMSTFLQTQSTFLIDSQTSLDVVTDDGQKVQFNGEAHYKVRKPNAFVLDFVSDSWNRQYIYDGTQFTLYAPTLGFFSTLPAPATIQATVAELGDRFGISLPLDDLFRWADPEGTRADALESAFLVGPETLQGVKTNHYAFREGKIDWQVWIQQGAQPLPRKLVIVDRRDPADPAYIASLTWTLNAPLTDADFVFHPGPDAKRIRTVLQK